MMTGCVFFFFFGFVKVKATMKKVFYLKPTYTSLGIMQQLAD